MVGVDQNHGQVGARSRGLGEGISLGLAAVVLGCWFLLNVVGVIARFIPIEIGKGATCPIARPRRRVTPGFVRIVVGAPLEKSSVDRLKLAVPGWNPQSGKVSMTADASSSNEQPRPKHLR